MVSASHWQIARKPRLGRNRDTKFRRANEHVPGCNSYFSSANIVTFTGVGLGFGSIFIR